MRASIICYLVLTSAVPFLNVEASSAEELSSRISAISRGCRSWIAWRSASEARSPD
jgi:hypothetical protein